MDDNLFFYKRHSIMSVSTGSSNPTAPTTLLECAYFFLISGKMGSGKDYTGQWILQNIKLYPSLARQNVQVLSLADFFKIRAIVFHKLPRETVYGQKTPESRKFLQEEGTEKGRKVVGESVWVDHLYQAVRNGLDRGTRVFIITDIRFPNEVAWVRQLVLPDYKIIHRVVRMVAPLRTLKRYQEEQLSMEQRLHPSETALDEGTLNWSFDMTIPNDPQDSSQVGLRLRDLLDSVAEERRRYVQSLVHAVKIWNVPFNTTLREVQDMSEALCMELQHNPTVAHVVRGCGRDLCLVSWPQSPRLMCQLVLQNPGFVSGVDQKKDLDAYVLEWFHKDVVLM